MPVLRSQRKLSCHRETESIMDEKQKEPYVKPKGVSISTPSQPPSKKARKQRGNGPHLTQLLKVYKGLDDWHLPIFRSVRAFVKPERVLYPGSSRHVIASLIFANVTYVDFDERVEQFFQDDRVQGWVQEHKDYEGVATFNFLNANFDSQPLPMAPASADLIVSACAGIVSQPCAKYLKYGGYLLVSDAHFDAREVSLDQRFQLIAVVGDDGTIGTTKEDLEGHFTTTDGCKLSRAQVEESKTKPKARRSFELQKEHFFYLYQKKL